MTDMIDYSMIPDHCREGMRMYIERGIIPGNFLKAVICNDLVGAAGAADYINQQALFCYAQFLYNAPGGCWGSSKKMYRWADIGGLQGIERTAEGIGNGE